MATYVGNLRHWDWDLASGADDWGGSWGDLWCWASWGWDNNWCLGRLGAWQRSNGLGQGAGAVGDGQGGGLGDGVGLGAVGQGGGLGAVGGQDGDDLGGVLGGNRNWRSRGLDGSVDWGSVHWDDRGSRSLGRGVDWRSVHGGNWASLGGDDRRVDGNNGAGVVDGRDRRAVHWCGSSRVDAVDWNGRFGVDGSSKAGGDEGVLHFCCGGDYLLWKKSLQSDCS